MSEKSIKSSLIKGVSFIALANYSGLIIGLIIISILARLLSPEDFGVVAIAMVFIVFFSLLSDAGIAPAIVQFKELTDKDINSIFGFTFWVGIVLSVTFFAISGLISAFYEKEILLQLCRILSIQVFFGTLNIVPNALLLKGKRFDIIAYRRISIQIFCGALAIFAAMNGIGIYALLIAPVLGIILEFGVNLFFSKLKIRLLFDISPVKKIFSFSAFQFLFNFINYFGRNLDKLIIGKSLGLTQLGYYSKSVRLIMLPVQNITGVISPVLHPILSDFQNTPEKIYDVYIKLTKLLAHIAFPVAAILFFTANELVLLMFGNQWGNAVLPFQILSFSVALQIPTVMAGAILQSLNKTKILFILGTINVIIAATGLLIATFVFGTLEAICIAAVITSFISFINSYVTIIIIVFREDIRIMTKIFLHPLLCYIVLFLLLYPLTMHLNVELIISFLIKITVWAILTFGYFQLFTEYKPTATFKTLVSKIKRQI